MKRRIAFPGWDYFKALPRNERAPRLAEWKAQHGPCRCHDADGWCRCGMAFNVCPNCGDVTHYYGDLGMCNSCCVLYDQTVDYLTEALRDAAIFHAAMLAYPNHAIPSLIAEPEYQ